MITYCTQKKVFLTLVNSCLKIDKISDIVEGNAVTSSYHVKNILSME